MIRVFAGLRLGLGMSMLASLLAAPGLAFGQQQSPNQSIGNAAAGAAQNVTSTLANLVGENAVTGQGPVNFASGGYRFALPGQRETGAAGAAGGKVWNAWVAFSNNSVANSFQPASTDGRVRVWTGGIDRTFQNGVRVGLALAGDQTDINLTGSIFAGGGTLRGRGYTVAPYIGVPINANWSFNGTVGYGRTRMDLNQGLASGSFDSVRTLGSLGLNYSRTLRQWVFGGRMALIASESRLGSYTQASGATANGATYNTSQARFGAQAGYMLNANVMPYFGLTYIYDLRRVDQAAVAGQTPSNDRDAWNAAVGVRFSSAGALYGGIQYSSDRARAQSKNDQWMLNLGLRF